MTTTETALNSKVHQLLLDQMERGTQLGSQVCAYYHGEKIVDTCGGQMGPQDPRPVAADTLFSSFSTTKGVAATALHILADRGIIEYEQPVAKYWPGFAKNGKEKVTVAQAMSHQAGLHTMPEDPVFARTLLDWENGLAYIENGTPAWDPGTATGYHAVTFAWVVGGIIQYASGRHIKQVLAEDIAGPLGCGEEMYIGIPDGVEDRLATLQTAEEQATEGGARRPQLQIPPITTCSRRCAPTWAGTSTTWTCGRPVSLRRTGTSAPARSPGCTAHWPTAARSTESASCPRSGSR